LHNIGRRLFEQKQQPRCANGHVKLRCPAGAQAQAWQYANNLDELPGSTAAACFLLLMPCCLVGLRTLNVPRMTCTSSSFLMGTARTCTVPQNQRCRSMYETSQTRCTGTCADDEILCDVGWGSAPSQVSETALCVDCPNATTDYAAISLCVK
jgi:hypothetical protein